MPRIRRTIRRKPVRVQLTPTSLSSRREPGTSTPAATMKAAELASPGTLISSSASSSALTTVTRGPLRRIVAPARSSMRSVWSRLRWRLGDRRRVIGGQRRQQDARLDLRACDGELVGDRVQPRAAHGQRREASVA